MGRIFRCKDRLGWVGRQVEQWNAGQNWLRNGRGGLVSKVAQVCENFVRIGKTRVEILGLTFFDWIWFCANLRRGTTTAPFQSGPKLFDSRHSKWTSNGSFHLTGDIVNEIVRALDDDLVTAFRRLVVIVFVQSERLNSWNRNRLISWIGFLWNWDFELLFWVWSPKGLQNVLNVDVVFPGQNQDHFNLTVIWEFDWDLIWG